MKKKALIFGVTGQDGYYLTDLLLKKKYEVHGVKRRSSSFNTGRIDKFINFPDEKKNRFYHHFGDITDSLSVSTLIKKINPDEIYNFAAQSHVAVSFETLSGGREPWTDAHLQFGTAIHVCDRIDALSISGNSLRPVQYAAFGLA